MSRKVLQTLVAIATFAVVWLVASPASAITSAPLCDPRGATGFAPPMQIQDTEQSLDIPADCFDLDPLESKHVVPGRGPRIDLSSSQEPASVTSLVVALPCVAGRVLLRPAVEARPPPGVRRSLDRPPRS
jgi:hypothetical protein